MRPAAAGDRDGGSEHPAMALSRLISSEQSVTVERPIDQVFDLLRSAPAWSNSVLAVVDESPPDAPYSLSRCKIGCQTSSMWLRSHIVTQEPPRRLGFEWRCLGVIRLGQRGEGEYILIPSADGSVALTIRSVLRLPLLNPLYWPVRASKVQARQQRSLHDFGEWAQSYQGAIPVPIETTHSQAVEHARQARPRRTRNVLAVLTASIGAQLVAQQLAVLLRGSSATHAFRARLVRKQSRRDNPHRVGLRPTSNLRRSRCEEWLAS